LCEHEACRSIFRSRRVRLVGALIDEYHLDKFFTLTLARDVIEERGVNAWDYIVEVWSRFRKRMNRLYDDWKYVAILEAHKETKYPHVHGFTDTWMKQSEWSRLWYECGGGGVVWIERIKSTGNASEYVGKYIGKQNLVEAKEHAGSHRTLWRSEGLKAKFELDKDEEWTIIKEDVYDVDGQVRPSYRRLEHGKEKPGG